MPEETLAAHLDIAINGRPAPRELTRHVVEVVVDDSLHLPDMFTLRIHDSDLRWIDSDLLTVGAEVEIRASAPGQGARSGGSGQLIVGEITALAPTFNRTGEPILTVQGYDRSHRLHRGKKSRSFRRVTDSEIAQQIAREAKLWARVDPTPVVHEYVFQDNQTDLAFLQTRAQNIGYEMYVKEQTLHFVRRETERAEGPQLVWGENLRDFRPRLSTMRQVDEVIVRSWDPQRKQEIVSRVNAADAGARQGRIAPAVGVSESGGELARRAFGVPSQMVVVNHPVANVDEANALAQALYDEISGDFIKAQGVCFGDPRIQAGSVVAIQGVGARFSGRYFVTAAAHIQNQDGYETAFHISGRHPDTLSSLLQPADGIGKNGNNQGWGIAIGLVTNNRDPQGQGRVKVRFPWLAESEESTWARIATPMGGKDRGLYCLPEINDEVLVAFEHGHITHPYVLGVLWNGKDAPPRQNDPGQRGPQRSGIVGRDGKVNRRILRSRSGHEIILDDTAGHERIIIRDGTAQNEIVIDSRKNDMAIKVKGDLTIEAGGEVNIRSRGDLTIHSDSKGEVEARDVSIEGRDQVDVKGRVINLN